MSEFNLNSRFEARKMPSFMDEILDFVILGEVTWFKILRIFVKVSFLGRFDIQIQCLSPRLLVAQVRLLQHLA